MGRWYARCRRLDLELLWPSCLDYAPTIQHAKAAFAVHAFNDRAWMVLGEQEVTRLIDGLTWPRGWSPTGL
jgi:hypothetical protein